MNTFLFVSLSCRVSASGVVLELMNGWTEINFCLPIKAHNLPFDSELCIMVSWIALDQTGFGPTVASVLCGMSLLMRFSIILFKEPFTPCFGQQDIVYTLISYFKWKSMGLYLNFLF